MSPVTEGITRREFLEVGAAAGLACVAGAACRTAAPAGRARGLAGPAIAPFALQEATVADLQQGMESGKYTAHALCEYYLARSEDLDGRGPMLRSVIETNPDALRIAPELDVERTTKGPRGPLHGIPILIKDNIATADRMATTAGSLALVGAKPPADAGVAARLRAAGAVMVGKANLSEWANFRSNSSSSGWSARGGQCKNPYVLDRSPCGSSSGTAAALAANFAAVGVGTETDGSIVCPAAACSLVGIKPTIGLVSRSGIVPIAHSQDSAGPMARTVADAAALLAAMAGPDPRDPETRRSGHTADYRKALNRDALRGARIGVARKRYFGYSPAADRLAEAAIEDMKARGAVIVDPADVPTVDQLDSCEFDVLLYEFKTDLNAYLAARPSVRVRSLTEIIAFNEEHKDREMPYFGQDIMVMAEEKGPLTSPAYRQAHATCRTLSRTDGLDATMKKFKLDAIVAPTGAPAWPIDHVNGDHVLGASSPLAAVAGYPNVTVPAGEISGLPIGISFMGRAWSEAKLIGLAYAYEQATTKRRPPRFLPTVALQ